MATSTLQACYSQLTLCQRGRDEDARTSKVLLEKFIFESANKDKFINSNTAMFKDIMIRDAESKDMTMNMSMAAIERANKMQMDCIDQMLDVKEDLADKVENHIQELAEMRREYERVINILLKKNARLQGKGDLGSHLMQLVNQRQVELREKYTPPSLSVPNGMLNAENIVANNLPLLN